MIRITIYKDQEEDYKGFDCVGHAAYGEYGEDIVCAGVSTLVINTINSIATFTGDKFSTDADEETGMIQFRFEKEAGAEARLLVHSMILGLQGIQNNYGNEYIMLDFKEV